MIDLLAVGGAHIDRTARLDSAHIAGASNPVTFSQTAGGGAFNALRVAKLRGIGSCAMMSVRGGDAGALDVEEALERADIEDLSGRFMDRQTPSYTAIIDVDGGLVTALADMALYDLGFDRQVRRKEGRERIAEAGAVLIDANLTETAIEGVCAGTNSPIFAMCISPAKAPRLKSQLADFDILFLNRAELKALSGDNEPDALFDLGVKRFAITDGGDGVLVGEDGTISKLAVPDLEAASIIDVTGAGDALTGGTIAAYLREDRCGLADCVVEGIACAQLALRVEGPLCEAAGIQDFDSVLARVRAANA